MRFLNEKPSNRLSNEHLSSDLKFTLIKTFMTYVLETCDPTASATAYEPKLKVVMGQTKSASAEGENCAYRQLLSLQTSHWT